MIRTLVLLLVCLGQALSNQVIVSPENVHVEGCVDTSNVFFALEGLQTLRLAVSRFVRNFDKNESFFSHFAMKFSDDIHSAMKIIKIKLRRLTGSETARSKRSPFDFVSDAGHYLFGFVSARQYRNLKANLELEFKTLHHQNNKMLEDISLNRHVLDKLQGEIHGFLEKLGDFNQDIFRVEQLLALSIQATAALQAVENVVTMLIQIRSDADMHLPSRLVIPPETLRQLLLQTNDDHQGLYPVFNGAHVDDYYKLTISTTANVDHKICQMLRIPLLSSQNHFLVSHQDCSTGSICFTNSVGTTMLYLSDFLSCTAVNLKDLPTICNARPCVSSDHSVICTMVNHTTAVIATKKPFELTVKCQRNTIFKIEGIYVLTIPPECSTYSSTITIHQVHTRKKKSLNLPLRALNVPFTIKDGLLEINQSGLQTQIFNSHHIKAMILPKIRGFDEDEFSWKDLHYSNMSISGVILAGVAICSVVALCFGYRVLLRRTRIPTQVNNSQPHNSGTNDGDGDKKNNESQARSVRPKVEVKGEVKEAVSIMDKLVDQVGQA